MSAPANTFSALMARAEALEADIRTLRYDLEHARIEEEIGSRPTVAGIVPIADLEKQAILHAVVAMNGNLMKASAALGLGKTTMYRKIRTLMGRETLARLRNGSPA